MGFMGSMFGSSERTKFIELFKEQIRVYLSRKFYLEGQQKDYYFGKSLIDDDFSVFYNVDMRFVIKDAIGYAYDQVWGQYEDAFFTGFRTPGYLFVDLSNSAFKIPVFSCDRLWYRDEDEYHFRIGYMPTGVLEDAIKENPERWEMYLKYKDEN